jgi:hypothetical protein
MGGLGRGNGKGEEAVEQPFQKRKGRGGVTLEAWWLGGGGHRNEGEEAVEQPFRKRNGIGGAAPEAWWLGGGGHRNEEGRNWCLHGYFACSQNLILGFLYIVIEDLLDCFNLIVVLTRL